MWFRNELSSLAEVSLYSHFFPSTWWVQNIWSAVDLLHRNPQHWYTVISSECFKPWQQDVGYNFVNSWQTWYATIIATTCFTSLLIERHNDQILPLHCKSSLFQTELISIWIWANSSTPLLNEFCCHLINTCWYVFLVFQ